MKTKEPIFRLIEDIEQISTDRLEQLLNSREYLFIAHCWQGRMQVTVNQDIYILDKEHILVCLPSFLIGNYMRTPDCRCTVLSMNMQHFARLIDTTFHSEPQWWEKFTLLQNNPVIHMDDRHQLLLQSYYELMKAHLANEQTPFRERMMERLMEMAYYELSAYFDNRVSDSNDEKIAQPDRLFRKFQDLLRTEYITEHEVQWYAEQLCITPKYLSDICREKSGKSASKWVHDRLTEEIRLKLIETDIPIKELAYRFRFPSQSFFGKYVKRVLGMSPQVYRVSHRMRT
ncbi:MAG: AraC family transcriptional regulator [Paludibacteraceae bacterium]|nr:AraC family transcriptional regulator [Paludibacteraceae bacterium]